MHRAVPGEGRQGWVESSGNQSSVHLGTVPAAEQHVGIGQEFLKQQPALPGWSWARCFSSYLLMLMFLSPDAHSCPDPRAHAQMCHPFLWGPGDLNPFLGNNSGYRALVLPRGPLERCPHLRRKQIIFVPGCSHPVVQEVGAPSWSLPCGMPHPQTPIGYLFSVWATMFLQVQGLM